MAIVLSIVVVLRESCVDASQNPRFGFAPRTRLTWVNGIGYNTTHMEKEAPKISLYFGGKPVDFYHNPTKMVDENDTRGYFSDLTQAGQQKYLGRITSEVNGLVGHLRAAVRSVEKQKGGIVVHIAHSQGALVTCLAAQQLTPLEMSKIEVISFGGATPVRSTPETPFRRCVNYYSLNDPLLFLNRNAESALRSGFRNHQSHLDDDEFCFLAPRVGDPIADHMLLGPTYVSALEWEGKRFERKYRSYLRRTVRHTILASLSVASTILQCLYWVLQRLAAVLIELTSRLRRRRLALVNFLAATILAIRMVVLAILARFHATVRGLLHRSAMPTATKESEPSRSKLLLPPSGSDATNPITFSPAATEPIAKQDLLWSIRRRSRPDPVGETRIEKDGM